MGKPMRLRDVTMESLPSIGEIETRIAAILRATFYRKWVSDGADSSTIEFQWSANWVLSITVSLGYRSSDEDGHEGKEEEEKVRIHLEMWNIDSFLSFLEDDGVMKEEEED
ncbi:hypothetical protein MRB53_004673 [Persea americana]|uniref:Uncharacterized protein n=1 Tax=Persea americana TaxID=3435 RepID=A0ACC2MB72_PERAE|nr:hypothetical protein MRB53_004673 [Persea americana]